MKRSLNAGVTQLELMISLAIMGMIAVVMANVLNLSRVSLDRTDLISRQTQMLLNHQTLRKWAEDIPLDFEGETAVEFVQGTSSEMRFRSSTADGTFDVDQPAEFQLILTQANVLVLSGSGSHPSNETKYSIQRVLAEDVTSLLITYYGEKSTRPTSKWHTQWQDPERYPDLVKIEWETGDGGTAPPLTFQPGKTERQSVMSLSSLVPPE